MRLAEYSIWLLPAAVQETTLADTVRRLSGELGGAVFAPHLTIQGDLTLPLEQLRGFTAELAGRFETQRWPVTAVESSAHFFRCLYLRFASTPGFESLQGALQALSKSTDGLSPFPHLSLAYGNAGPAHIQARADLAGEFTTQEIVFDRLSICRSSKNIAIADWQNLSLFPLRPPEQD
jgi:2'-5' RNA ligase